MWRFLQRILHYLLNIEWTSSCLFQILIFIFKSVMTGTGIVLNNKFPVHHTISEAITILMFSYET